MNGVAGVRVGENAITNLGYERKTDGRIIFNIQGRRHLIRLKRIYNFLCSMLVFTPFA
jgi:hypothetical protein